MVKKYLFIALGIITLIIIPNAKAATREELLKYYPEEYLNSVSEERYAKLLTLDVSKAQTKEVELSDETKYDSPINPLANPVETTAKTLSLSIIPYQGTIDYAVTLGVVWKQIPVRRSYDVIAIRIGNNIGMAAGTAAGAQLASTRSVSYGYGGTNMNFVESKGFGISMNLVDDVINSLKCFIEVDIALGTASTSGTIYGAYEHAIDNVSLSQSKDYSIAAVGMGGVINFADSVWPHYDAMNGVSMTFSR